MEYPLTQEGVGWSSSLDQGLNPYSNGIPSDSLDISYRDGYVCLNPYSNGIPSD